MRRLAEYAALAVGIAVPLWVRQQRLERALLRRDRQIIGEIALAAEHWNDWGRRLIKQLQRALDGAPR